VSVDSLSQDAWASEVSATRTSAKASVSLGTIGPWRRTVTTVLAGLARTAQ
jgi:hypothetical protein